MRSGEAPQRPSTSWPRLILVVAVTLWVLGESQPSLSRLWRPLGVFGYQAGPDGRVIAVAPNSPASRAGLETGDGFDVAATPPDERRFAVGPYFGASGPGITIRLPLESGRTVTMTSVAEQLSLADKGLVVLRTLGAVLFALVGASLVLLRPSAMTWGLFFFTTGFSPGSDATSDALLPPALYPFDWFLESLTIAAGSAGFLAFALRFPAAHIAGWRRPLSRLVPWAFAALALLDAYCVGAPFFAAHGSVRATQWYYGLSSLLFVAGLIALWATYRRADGEDRQRMKWVLAGAAVGLPAFALACIFELTSTFPTPPYWVICTLVSLSLLVPVAIAYAVIRHHVIDITFVISRALVYAVLTALLVAAFALADWLLGRELSSSGLAVAAEVGISIAFAFWLNSLHHRVDRFVDSTLFRTRHLAERRLERVARALPHARTQEVVSELLVREPVDALVLVSAALFTRTPDESFAREAAIGWDAGHATSIDPGDTLVVHLEAEQTPIDVHDIRWTRADVPSGPAHPHLAVPIVVRRRLVAFVLYGGHANGVALDPDEIRIIGGLMTGAGAAFDHLDAESMRRESQSLRQEAVNLQRRVEELQAELDLVRARPSQKANL